MTRDMLGAEKVKEVRDRLINDDEYGSDYGSYGDLDDGSLCSESDCSHCFVRRICLEQDEENVDILLQEFI